MKMYRVRSSSTDIKEFEIIRSTEKTIWFLDSSGIERRALIDGAYEKFFKSKEGAKNHLLDRTQREVQILRGRLDGRMKLIEKIKNL